jgi:hypothetical protein
MQKLTVGTEQLRAHNILRQHDVNNLRSIIKQRTTRTKRKWVGLKGHFHISTQELCDAVIAAEKATKTQARKKMKSKAKVRSDEVENECEVEKDGQDDSGSEIGDCVVVDLEQTNLLYRYIRKSLALRHDLSYSLVGAYASTSPGDSKKV